MQRDERTALGTELRRSDKERWVISDAIKSVREQILTGSQGVSLLGLVVAPCRGVGAATSAGTGHSPAKGALIGAGVGAAGGAIYEIAK